MKQTKLWLTTIAVLLCSLAASAHDFEVGGIYYNIKSTTDLTVAVTYGGSSYDSYSNEYSGAVTIPETVTYNNNTYSVTSIGYGAFYGCSSLTAITIPEGVTSIGNCAFDDCTALQNVIIEDGSTTLSLGYNHYYSSGTGQGLFYDCPLEEVYLGRNLSYSSYSSDGYSPFYKSNRIPVITLGNSVTTISPYLFYGNTNLTFITIPESVTSIGEDAFSGCRSLTAITIPEGVTSIGDYAFSGCSSLTAITIPESVTSIGSSAFYNCSSLYKVFNCSNLSLSKGSSSNGYVAYYAKVIYICKGSQLTTVGDFQFYTSNSTHSLVNYIGNDTEIVLPDSYNGENYKIGDCAFSGCSRLTSITISEGVTSIGNYAFANCTALKKVIIEDGSTTLSLGYNHYYNNSSIGQGLFYNCPLEEVYLGRNLSYSSDKSYGYSPFYNKDKLTNVTIGNEVTQISQYAFYGCYNIHSLTMGNGVLSIEGNTFSTPDKAIWLTNTPPTGYAYAQGSINYVANDQYTSLSNVKVYPYLSSMFEVDGVKYVPVSPSERTCHAIDCAYDSTATTINVGETVSFKGVAMKVAEVMPYAFYGNNYVRELSISHLNAIRTYTFYGCRNLREFIIPDSVKTIEAYCFGECSLLSEITIPQAVTSIGDYIFSGCSQLADVIIEDRTTALSLGSNGSSALFADCPLDSVYIGGKITYSTTSSKGYSPFYRNTSLRSVVITDREEQIYDNEFYGCTNLKNVAIGNGVKSIGDYAFSGCSSLEGFSFGSSMESIGDEAFSDCTSLTSITSHAAVPPICGTQALDDINKWECVLGVPLGNADAYYAADQWKEFFFIDDVVEVDHYVLTYVVDGEVVHTEVLKHKDEVTMLAEPTKVGYEFSGWDKTLATMPAEDVIISGTFTRLPVDNLVILDTEENFLIDEEMECEMVTYTRHFNDTQWQALYVPFEIPVTEEFLAGFEVADLNNVHQYDRDNDGVTDETVIEAFKLTSGTLEANYPYLIRAKEAGEKSITVTDAALYATEENSIDCSSVRDKFTFTGTYSSLSSAELPQGEGYYTLIEGEWKPVTEAVSLGAFRFYLKVDSRSGALAAEARSIRMRIIGENGEDDTTGMTI